MMLGEESESADYWKKCGDEALFQGIKGVIMMVILWIPHHIHERLTNGKRAPIGIVLGARKLKYQ